MGQSADAWLAVGSSHCGPALGPKLGFGLWAHQKQKNRNKKNKIKYNDKNTIKFDNI